MVISVWGKPDLWFGHTTPSMVVRLGKRPVSRAARLGEQTEEAE